MCSGLSEIIHGSNNGLSARINALLDKAADAFANDDIMGALLLLKQADAEYKKEIRS